MAGTLVVKRLLFVVSEDWYFVSHRLHLAEVAIEAGYQVGLLSRLSTCREKIEQAGIEVFDWSLDRRSRNPLSELRAVAGVVIAIRKFEPELLHAVAMKPVLYSALAAWWTGVHRRVFALGGLGFVFTSSKPLARGLRPIVVRALRLALSGGYSRLILQNADDQASLIGSGVIELERVQLIRGVGVDTSTFLPKRESPGVPLVVLPARMLWDKGVGDFVACARALRARGVIGRFALVGEPDIHNPECVSAAQLNDWVAEGVVEWWGQRGDMPAVLASAHVVCLPSYREGLPKALLEAASCGRPIVTFDVAGCREVVEDGENGFLVPFKDVSTLTDVMGRLLTDRGLRQRMGAAGREKVLREFSIGRIAEETLRVWDEMLA